MSDTSKEFNDAGNKDSFLSEIATEFIPLLLSAGLAFGAMIYLHPLNADYPSKSESHQLNLIP
jgi:hypothetical protein